MEGLNKRERGVDEERCFVVVLHPERGNNFWTCVEDNMMQENDVYNVLDYVDLLISYFHKRRVRELYRA